MLKIIVSIENIKAKLNNKIEIMDLIRSKQLIVYPRNSRVISILGIITLDNRISHMSTNLRSSLLYILLQENFEKD